MIQFFTMFQKLIETEHDKGGLIHEPNKAVPN